MAHEIHEAGVGGRLSGIDFSNFFKSRRVNPSAASPSVRNCVMISECALGCSMSVSVWSVYIIRCGDGSIYTSISTDVDRRFTEHESQGPEGANSGISNVAA